MNMNLSKLQYLNMLAEECNVTKAAKRLYISQPTLTTFLNNLEKDLGFHLFDRSSNPIKITKEGKAYIQKMKILLLEEQQLIERLQKNSLAKNEFRIGIGQVNSQIHIPDIVSALLKQHPFLNITISENPEQKILNDLKKDKIDLMFGHVPVDRVNYVFEEVMEQSMLLMIPENLLNPYEFYPVDKHRPDIDNIYSESAEMTTSFPDSSPSHPIEITPSLLSSMPIIEPNTSQALYMNLRTLIDSYPIHPIRIIRSANMITATKLLQMGLGYMYSTPELLSFTHTPTSQKIIYCTLPKMQLSRKYYAIYKRDNANLEYIREAIQLMKSQDTYQSK